MTYREFIIDQILQASHNSCRFQREACYKLQHLHRNPPLTEDSLPFSDEISLLRDTLYSGRSNIFLVILQVW